MSDENERSVASAGSATDSGWRFGNESSKDEWIAEALKASFLGVPIGDLSRTELLAAFGAVLQQRITEQELADSVKRMFSLAKRLG